MSYGSIRDALSTAGDDLKRRFEAGESVAELVHARSKLIDEVLIQLWHEQVEACGAALLAVGGFGRGVCRAACGGAAAGRDPGDGRGGEPERARRETDGRRLEHQPGHHAAADGLFGARCRPEDH